MQLREAEFIGAIDNDGVSGRDIDTRLDNGCTDQQIEALLIKVFHHVLQLALTHLPVCDINARFRQEAGKLFLHGLNGADFIVQEIDLTTALQFAQGCFAYDSVRKTAYEGFYGKPTLRCRGYNRKITQAFERHCECAWDRSGGKGQYIHVRPQILELFFVPYPEPVLLINN